VYVIPWGEKLFEEEKEAVAESFAIAGKENRENGNGGREGEGREG
jgi:hypothetical protein